MTNSLLNVSGVFSIHHRCLISCDATLSSMNQITSRPLCALALALLLPLAGCVSRGAPSDAAAVSQASAAREAIDLDAFMGRWYVIARIPNVIERGHMGGRLDYSLNSPEEVGIAYSYRNGPREPWRQLDITGAVLPDSGNREWRVRFFRFVPTTQRVLEIDTDGQWALLDSPGRDLAWILARDPAMDEATYRDLRERLRSYGVDVDKVWRVVHDDAQIGARGFDQPSR